MSTHPQETLSTLVDKLSNQCVKCALCLPHCPTYALTQDENESPRGRIALFQALNHAQLPLNTQVKRHLDQCLGCRACERVCPAHVEYGRLLINGRARLQQLSAPSHSPHPPLRGQLIRLLTYPKTQRLLHWLLWGIEMSGLRKLAQHLSIPKRLGLAELDALLPPLLKPTSYSTCFSALGPKQGTVSLFKGCMTSLADQQTIEASIFVLRHLGYDVLVPPTQTCCGAIDLHAGNIQQAATFAKQNRFAFEKADYIITMATGCSSILQEYPDYFDSSDLFSKKIMDIMDFVQKCEWPNTLSLRSLPIHVLLHTPCTRRNVLKTIETPEALLRKIPDLQLHHFTSSDCCGAAGTYMLEHTQEAKSLANQLLSELKAIKVDKIVTTNIGCALHLSKELKAQQKNVSVCHPITLLASACA